MASLFLILDGSRMAKVYRKKSRSRYTRSHGRKSQMGGALGSIYSFGAPVVPGLGNSAEVIPSSSCLAVDNRFGTVSMPTSGLGLPGFKGGARSKRQRGGRYSFDLSAPFGNGAAGQMGGPPPVVAIPCEASRTAIPPQSGGVGGVDSAFYTAPTAGYAPQASTWVSQSGTPSLLSVPYDARAMNPACLKTGGSRRHKSKRASRRASRRVHKRRQ